MTALDKYKAAHRTACKSWDMPPNFPEQKVLDAYANPSVDSSKSTFTFQKPDIAILRGYCLRQFNWSQVLALAFLLQRGQQHRRLLLHAVLSVRGVGSASERLHFACRASLSLGEYGGLLWSVGRGTKHSMLSSHADVQDQADTLLQPVLKQYEEKETQLRLDAFWTVTHRFAKIRSKRLQAAISTSLGRDLPQEMIMAPEDDAHREAPKAKAKAKAGGKASASATPQQPRRTGTRADGARHGEATAQNNGQNKDQVSGIEGSTEEEEEDEIPADVPRYDLPAGDPADDGGLDLGMDSYRAQFFY